MYIEVCETDLNHSVTYVTLNLISTMTKGEVIAMLEENKNERGILNSEKFAYENWTSFGIGLTQLKKLSKVVRRNHELAKELWLEPNYDIKTMAILIEEPKKVDQNQIEEMVNDVGMWILSHTWIQNLFCKVSFAKELAEKWRASEDDLKRRCGYGYLYYLAKDKKMGDDYFIPILKDIEEQLQCEENYVKDAMNNALFALGQKSKFLNEKCILIATNIGKVKVDYGENSCEAVDVIKHLTSERIQNKLI